MQVIAGAGEFTRPVAPFDTNWAEQFRVPDLSVGTYSIPVGGTDDQEPHTEDEIYVITAGLAGFEADGKRIEVGPGTVIFVPAKEEHRFVDVTEDLAALVLFGPAEGSRSVTRVVAFVTTFADAFNDAASGGDFARLIAMFTEDAVVRAGSEYVGRAAIAAAYAERPPDDEIELTGDPREEDGAVLIDFSWRRNGSPGSMRLTVTDDDLISELVVVPAN
ncbi:MAG TPA: cupin domain-containing protein [Streptosporangiaceae bacterium]|nr:cupin domain-containing protein [Streptosporangiaceae bacterium]